MAAMMQTPTRPSRSDATPRAPGFATTRWTLVAASSDAERTAPAEAALDELCRAYWVPIYAFVRHRGASRDDAEDLTQAFFAHLLEKRTIAAARRERGRFRTFLLAALKHFLADEWDKSRAQKRGGGQALLSLDVETAEERYLIEPVDHLTPTLHPSDRHSPPFVVPASAGPPSRSDPADGPQEKGDARSESWTGFRACRFNDCHDLVLDMARNRVKLTRMDITS
jgi:hypothetical protein